MASPSVDRNEQHDDEQQIQQAENGCPRAENAPMNRSPGVFSNRLSSAQPQPVHDRSDEAHPLRKSFQVSKYETNPVGSKPLQFRCLRGKTPMNLGAIHLDVTGRFGRVMASCML